MKIQLVAMVVLASFAAHAQTWFTVMGNPIDRAVDSVELNLEGVQPRGAVKHMEMRVTLAQVRVLPTGEAVGSYVSIIEIGCTEDSIVHVQQTRFPTRRWDGVPTVERFESERPMAFRGLDPNPKTRILKAACNQQR
jgi:hypothetical protein